MNDKTAPSRGLAHLPVAVFAIVMGLAGLAIAWLQAAVLGAPHEAGRGFALVALAAFLVCAVFYGAKLFRHPQAVAAEWRHPVRLNFFAAISISLLLLAAIAREALPFAMAPFWLAGALAHAALTLAIVSAWLGPRGFEPASLSPAAFIPAVGNIVAPLGAPAWAEEVAWGFFAVGLFFWLVLFAAVFWRLKMHAPLPPRLQPAFAILVAPPAVAFLAWVQLGGVVDAAARVFFYLALFFGLLVVLRVPQLVRLPFAVGAWATSFPAAALTVAVIRYAEYGGLAFYGGLAVVLLSFTTLLIAALFARTLVALVRGELWVEER